MRPSFLASLVAAAMQHLPGRGPSIHEVKQSLQIPEHITKLLDAPRYRQPHSRNKTSKTSQKKRRIQARRRWAMGDKKAFA